MRVFVASSLTLLALSSSLASEAESGDYGRTRRPSSMSSPPRFDRSYSRSTQQPSPHRPTRGQLYFPRPGTTLGQGSYRAAYDFDDYGWSGYRLSIFGDE